MCIFKKKKVVEEEHELPIGGYVFPNQEPDPRKVLFLFDLLLGVVTPEQQALVKKARDKYAEKNGSE